MRRTHRLEAVTELAALGKSNKVIAFELGIALSTVANYIACAKRMYGARSRVELVVFRCDSDGYLVLEQLTAAEHAVASDAIAGLTNAEIALKRGRSNRTIANQLASIYRKLGIHSRAELACAAVTREQEMPGTTSLTSSRVRAHAPRPPAARRRL